jgi:hypothetical protein
MALSPSFTVGNNASVTSTFLVTDTSTGSDIAIANRLLYLYDYSNVLFTGSPIQFPLSAGLTLSPAILTQDFAFAATMVWTDSGGNPLYTVSGQLGVFTGFLESFIYGLTQQIAANSSILNDTLFSKNWGDLRNLIDSANQAISIVGSVYNSQSMVILAQKSITNSNYNF